MTFVRVATPLLAMYHIYATYMTSSVLEVMMSVTLYMPKKSKKEERKKKKEERKKKEKGEKKAKNSKK